MVILVKFHGFYYHRSFSTIFFAWNIWIFMWNHLFLRRVLIPGFVIFDLTYRVLSLDLRIIFHIILVWLVYVWLSIALCMIIHWIVVVWIWIILQLFYLWVAVRVSLNLYVVYWVFWNSILRLFSSNFFRWIYGSASLVSILYWLYRLILLHNYLILW